LVGKERIELQKRFDTLKTRHEAMRKERWEAAERDRDKSPISIPYLLAQVWEVIKNEDWALVNKDIHGWARCLWDWEKPYQYIGNSFLGCGLGQSLGAALAHRREGRLCIDLQADGDFLYTPAGLWTAARHSIPLLIIMNNNRSYYNSEFHQETMARIRGRHVENKGIGTQINYPPVDYVSLAHSFGLYAQGPIKDPNDLRPALEQAIKIVKNKKQPALVDVVTQPGR